MYPNHVMHTNCIVMCDLSLQYICVSTAPSPVRNIKVIAISSSSINITWDEPAEPNGIVSYRITVVSHRVFNTSDTFFVVGELKPFTEYFVNVQPYTRAGFGVKSRENEVKTMQSSMLFMNIRNCCT